MLYTDEVKKAVHSVPKPVPVAVHVVEYPDHLRLRVYENQILNLATPERIKVMEFLNMLEQVVKSFGIQCVPEGVKGDPQ